jgi:hypothetical protein
MAGWRPLWRGLKRALGTVASSRRRGQDDRSQHGLASKLDSAETPRSQQAPEDAGAKHTCIDVHGALLFPTGMHHALRTLLLRMLHSRQRLWHSDSV